MLFVHAVFSFFFLFYNFFVWSPAQYPCFFFVCLFTFYKLLRSSIFFFLLANPRSRRHAAVLLRSPRHAAVLAPCGSASFSNSCLAGCGDTVFFLFSFSYTCRMTLSSKLKFASGLRRLPFADTCTPVRRVHLYQIGHIFSFALYPFTRGTTVKLYLQKRSKMYIYICLSD